MNNPPASTQPFVHLRKPHSWTSPAHPTVTVFYFWAKDEPVQISEILVSGHTMTTSELEFFRRFGFGDELDGELANFLYGLHE